MTTSNDDRTTVETANLTGFPFQLAIEKQFNSWHDTRYFRWESLKREFPWRDELGSEFIDLIFWNRAKIRIVVECKRVLHTSKWIFIQTSDESNEQSHFLMPWWVRHPQQYNKEIFGYKDVQCTPVSLEATMSTANRKDGQIADTIDSECSKLIRATESLIEFDIVNANNNDALRVYFPMMITNASLKVVTTDANKISLSDGKIADGVVNEVPYLRYRKSFLSALQPNLNPQSKLVNASIGMDRSIFIVNASHLHAFMVAFNNFELSFEDLLK